MSATLHWFTSPLAGPDGRSYLPRVCGQLMEDGHRWEGWLEFVPAEAGNVLRTPRETVQPNWTDLLYWAGGLSYTYLEGALSRAAGGGSEKGDRARHAVQSPASGGFVRRSPAVYGNPAINPFHVYMQGEQVLRQELSALSIDHLQRVAHAYALLPDQPAERGSLQRAELAEQIVTAVRVRLGIEPGRSGNR